MFFDVLSYLINMFREFLDFLTTPYLIIFWVAESYLDQLTTWLENVAFYLGIWLIIIVLYLHLKIVTFFSSLFEIPQLYFFIVGWYIETHILVLLYPFFEIQYLHFLIIYEYAKIYLDISNWSICASLMIQFGTLVMVLSFVCLLAPNYFGLYGAFMIIIIPLFFAWIYSLLTLVYIYESSNTIFINGFKWFYLPGHILVTFDIFIDKLSITYVSLVLSIGFCVIIYTFSYFRYEPHVERLFLFINLFMISMCILVLGGNLFVLFLGWELIGLTSFILINFWSTKISTLKSAFKAFIFNKISDLGILLFILLNFVVIQEWNIPILNSIFINLVNYRVNVLGVNISYIELLAWCLMISAFIKSAQFGFHIWLPDSMEAPVPASALIHSATLVSAGVFLILRFSFLFELSSITLQIILWISSLTAAFGGVCACFQSDVKKILAYSTISHCGFLIFLACISNLEITLFYLCIHGFFKAIIFMCIGNVIRFSRNYQDFRYMGGFFKYLPFETIVTLIGLINLSGLPLSFGFLIKHYTLITLFDLTNYFVKINLIIGMFTGLIYSYRLYYYIFFDVKKAKKSIYVTASNHRLKSKFYSNTTLASCIAISLLLVITTLLGSYIYLSCFVFDDINNSLIFLSQKNNNNYLVSTTPETMNNLSFYINIFVLMLGIILIALKFRYQLFLDHFYYKLNFITIFSFFFFVLSYLIF